MKTLRELASAFSIKPMMTAILAPLAIGAVLLVGTAASAQTADGVTPAEEMFCDDSFDGRLRGLCNAFCEAMDCDSLEAQASANACLKMEQKIAPLLAENNAQFDPDLVISMANPMTGVEGVCGVGCTITKPLPAKAGRFAEGAT